MREQVEVIAAANRQREVPRAIYGTVEVALRATEETQARLDTAVANGATETGSHFPIFRQYATT